MKKEYAKINNIKINETNWKEHSKEIAELIFPVGIDIQCAQSFRNDPSYNNFFRVNKITPTGIIITNELDLEEKKRDCDQGGGWIDYDLKTAKVTENIVKFLPCLEWDRQPKNKKPPIEWRVDYYVDWYGIKHSGYYSPIKISHKKNGLVRAVIGSIL